MGELDNNLELFPVPVLVPVRLILLPVECLDLAVLEDVERRDRAEMDRVILPPATLFLSLPAPAPVAVREDLDLTDIDREDLTDSTNDEEDSVRGRPCDGGNGILDLVPPPEDVVVVDRKLLYRLG